MYLTDKEIHVIPAEEHEPAIDHSQQMPSRNDINSLHTSSSSSSSSVIAVTDRPISESIYYTSGTFLGGPAAAMAMKIPTVDEDMIESIPNFMDTIPASTTTTPLPMTSEGLMTSTEAIHHHHHPMEDYDDEALMKSEESDLMRALLAHMSPRQWEEFAVDLWRRTIHTGEAHVLILISLYVVAFAVGLATNMGVIHLIRTGDRALRHTNHRMLYGNCIANLVQILVCYPLAVYHAATSLWALGSWMCFSSHYLAVVSLCGSSFSMMFLNVDRYLTVNHPAVVLRYNQARLSWSYTAVAWSLAALIALPYAFVRRLYTDTVADRFRLTFCLEHWPTTHLKILTSAAIFLIVYFIPCVVQIYCQLSSSSRSTVNVKLPVEDRKKRKGSLVAFVRSLSRRSGDANDPPAAAAAAINSLADREDIRKKAFRVRTADREAALLETLASPQQKIAMAEKNSGFPCSSSGSTSSSSMNTTLGTTGSAPSLTRPTSSSALSSCIPFGVGKAASFWLGTNRPEDTVSRDTLDMCENLTLDGGTQEGNNGSRHAAMMAAAAAKLVGGYGLNLEAGGGEEHRKEVLTTTMSTVAASGMVTTTTTRQITRTRFVNYITAMTLSFVLCWFPYHLLSFFFDYLEDPALAPWLLYALFAGHLHCVLSPIIFWFVNRPREPQAGNEEGGGGGGGRSGGKRDRSSLLVLRSQALYSTAAVAAGTTLSAKRSVTGQSSRDGY